MRRPALAALPSLALTLALASSPVRAAEGPDVAALWSKKCASCHAESGDGQTKMGLKSKVDDLTTASWQKKHDDAEVRTAIEEGKEGTKMKAFKDKLSADEITALVAHIRTLGKK
jgi:cytochrome c553